MEPLFRYLLELTDHQPLPKVSMQKSSSIHCFNRKLPFLETVLSFASSSGAKSSKTISDSVIFLPSFTNLQNLEHIIVIVVKKLSCCATFFLLCAHCCLRVVVCILATLCAKLPRQNRHFLKTCRKLACFPRTVLCVLYVIYCFDFNQIKQKT